MNVPSVYFCLKNSWFVVASISKLCGSIEWSDLCHRHILLYQVILPSYQYQLTQLKYQHHQVLVPCMQSTLGICLSSETMKSTNLCLLVLLDKNWILDISKTESFCILMLVHLSLSLRRCVESLVVGVEGYESHTTLALHDKDL